MKKQKTRYSHQFFTLKPGTTWLWSYEIPSKKSLRPILRVRDMISNDLQNTGIDGYVIGIVYLWGSREDENKAIKDLEMDSSKPVWMTFTYKEIVWLTVKEANAAKRRHLVSQL